MFAAATVHRRLFVDALSGLRALRFAMAFTRRPVRAAECGTDRDGMALPALDELGLLSGEGCISDWGLVERAARFRSGWS